MRRRKNLNPSSKQIGVRAGPDEIYAVPFNFVEPHGLKPVASLLSGAATPCTEGAFGPVSIHPRPEGRCPLVRG